MPKFNADESNYEPIEVVLNGNTYTVEKVEQDMFDKVKAVAKETQEKLKDGEEDISVVNKQVGIILGVDPSEFNGIDVRKMASVLRFLTETITGQVEGSIKND